SGLDVEAGRISNGEIVTSCARAGPSCQSLKQALLDLPDAGAPHPGRAQRRRLRPGRHRFSRLEGILPNYHDNFLPDYREPEHNQHQPGTSKRTIKENLKPWNL